MIETEKQNNKISVYVEGIKTDIGWVDLPVTEKDLKAITKRATGEEHGKDYILSDHSCGFFAISENEDLEILNKVAEMIGTLNREETYMLKGWCSEHQLGMSDMTEIGNAVVQIKEGKMRYLDGVKTEEELGEWLIKDTGLDRSVRGLLKERLNLDADYIDCESVGRDFDINNEYGYFVVDLFTKNKIVGYVMDDSNIDEFLYTTEEIFHMDIQQEMGADKRTDPMKECMKRTADRSPKLPETYKER